ncbi:conserved Plasmodium protein, unknown function [Plasmodium relictum]|uniref:Uncharacterized protein n=1 Tax=Plasmodium relictum TaxID=85471 RepID=A0A1J1H680_PLARL|nr:conserved Plasmodium protein, unknown function [Plasmodium relictum]CRH00186.1 conserved Plasmodium protein, unknown function [Plasmodium relictum]
MNMDMAYSMRNVMNSARNVEPKYDMNSVDLANNTMNTNYLMNGAVLTNAYNNDFMANREKYPADMISQLKLEQALKSYNNTMPMNATTIQDPNDSISVHGMKTNLGTTGFESYGNLMNYNNTQNTIQANQIPINLDDYNNSDAMYINPNTGDKFSAEYINNLPTTDPDTILYSNNFKIPNGNFSPMMHNNFNNIPYSMPIFENMNNPQMYMQNMNQKRTINIPLPNMEHKTSIRKIPAVTKRRIKPKKFFPCC